MDTRSTDPRFQRSRAAVLAAITALLDQRPMAEISITQLVAEAGITRPTFYQHFPDLAAAATAAALDRLAQAFPVRDRPEIACFATGPERGAAVATLACPVLEHLLAHRTFYLRVVESSGTADFFDDLVRFVGQRMLTEVTGLAEGASPARQQDLTTFLAGGTTWLVLQWLRGPAPDGPQAMAERLGWTVVRALETRA